MEKIHQFLCQHAESVKRKKSGSSYYVINKHKIRISDHLSPLYNTKVLCIFASNKRNQYIAHLKNDFMVFNTFKSLKLFLENWMFLSVEKEESKKETKKETKKPKSSKEPINLKSLTKKQLLRIKAMIAEKTNLKQENFTKTIDPKIFSKSQLCEIMNWFN